MVVLSDSWSRFGPPDPDATRYLFGRRSLARTQVPSTQIPLPKFLYPSISLTYQGSVLGNVDRSQQADDERIVSAMERGECRRRFANQSQGFDVG